MSAMALQFRPLPMRRVVCGVMSCFKAARSLFFPIGVKWLIAKPVKSKSEVNFAFPCVAGNLSAREFVSTAIKAQLAIPESCDAGMYGVAFSVLQRCYAGEVNKLAHCSVLFTRMGVQQ